MCQAGLAPGLVATAAAVTQALEAQVGGLHCLQVFTSQLEPQLGCPGERRGGHSGPCDQATTSAQ